MHAPFTLAADSPVGHVIDHATIVGEGDWWWWSATATMLVIAGLVTVFVGIWAAKHIDTGPESEGHDRYVTRNPFAHTLEVICVFLRDEIARPMLHHRTDRFMPFLWTLFFFILTCNLLGLIPLLDLHNLLFPGLKDAHRSFIGGTATQSIYVTGVLALVAGIVINIAGVRELGLWGYIHHLGGGVPFKLAYAPILAIVIPIEFIGQLIKPTALAIRLFANMTAGHILLAQMLLFTGTGWAAGVGLGALVLVVATLGATAIFFLEIFVALLQAFIFMFLTTVFISLLAHHDEEHSAHEHTAMDTGEHTDTPDFVHHDAPAVRPAVA